MNWPFIHDSQTVPVWQWCNWMINDRFNWPWTLICLEDIADNRTHRLGCDSCFPYGSVKFILWLFNLSCVNWMLVDLFTWMWIIVDWRLWNHFLWWGIEKHLLLNGYEWNMKLIGSTEYISAVSCSVDLCHLLAAEARIWRGSYILTFHLIEWLENTICVIVFIELLLRHIIDLKICSYKNWIVGQYIQNPYANLWALEIYGYFPLMVAIESLDLTYRTLTCAAGLHVWSIILWRMVCTSYRIR